MIELAECLCGCGLATDAHRRNLSSRERRWLMFCDDDVRVESGLLVADLSRAVGEVINPDWEDW